jgi:hypothetical protein
MNCKPTRLDVYMPATSKQISQVTRNNNANASQEVQSHLYSHKLIPLKLKRINLCPRHKCAWTARTRKYVPKL